VPIVEGIFPASPMSTGSGRPQGRPAVSLTKMYEQPIVEFLRRKQDFVSGEEISRHLQLTRQALWKHIRELRERGYGIEAVPHLGYKLISSPDRLYPEEITGGLGTKLIGRKEYYFEKTTSTMDEARRIGRDAPDGTIVVAEAQSKGRGRMGRIWSSPKYKGLYVSIILKPDILPSQAPVLSLLAAVGICEGIAETTGLHPGIKWPNDIILDGKKLGGILTELEAELDRILFVVVAFGLNVNNGPDDLVEGAVSLKVKTGEQVNRVELLRAVLRGIERDYALLCAGGAAPVLEKWKTHSITLGKRVKVDCHREHIEGEAVDIDDDGGLLVRGNAGIISKFVAGDIVHLR
jgi:BirA family transcriptional regulator, biotin operon repressor / biotin---[acetyl-CoA-carboxylase] ligase